MQYAKVVLGLKVEGPFDYIIPGHLRAKISPGSRVLVNFGFRKKVVGFVVGTSAKTGIQNLKPVLEVLDDTPLVSQRLLELARRLADYYCCSLGEVIETALPEALRKPKRFAVHASPVQSFVRHGAAFETQPNRGLPVGQAGMFTKLVYDISGTERWDIYRKEIEATLKSRASVIILLPDVPTVLRIREMLVSHFGTETIEILYRKQPGGLGAWLKIKEGKKSIVAGTRSAVFAPLDNLGLVIMDEEQDFVYKQDQVPHYHAREVACMRCSLENARLILGSRSPSVETFYLAKEGKIQYEYIPRTKGFPDVKISDMRNMPLFERRKKTVLSRYLLDSMVSTLNASGKTLLFLNRKGFATAAACSTCGHVLKCPRCSSNLVYHFQNKELHCAYCNFSMQSPKLCPECNSGYIKFSGMGTEKIESEVARLIPQARIKRPQGHAPLALNEADIFVASEGALRGAAVNFDLIGVLSIDNALNRIDFRGGEKTFALLSELWELTDKKIIIQTRIPRHYCFRALQEKNADVFYLEELKQRKELRLPPFSHIALVKLRGGREERVKEISLELFESLRANKKTGIRVISVNPGQPSKLRGNYYWQILLGSASPEKISRFLKSQLKNVRHSGIIVTVDVDPL